jgi:hypothetical protein
VNYNAVKNLSQTQARTKKLPIPLGAATPPPQHKLRRLKGHSRHDKRLYTGSFHELKPFKIQFLP